MDRPLKYSRRGRAVASWFSAVAAGGVFLSGAVLAALAARPEARFQSTLDSLRAEDAERVAYSSLYFSRRSGWEPSAALVRAWFRLWGEHGKQKEEQNAAAEDLILALEDSRCRSFALALMGRVCYAQELTVQAVQLLQRALRENPDEVEAHRWLGIAAYDIGNTALAASHLQRVAELEPADGRPHRLIGLMLKEQDQYAAAAAAYERSLSRDPSQTDAPVIYLELAQCRFSQRNYDGALAALEHCPATAEAMLVRAECYRAQAKTDAANDALERALAQKPQPPQALALKATLCTEARQEREAVVWLTKAMESEPNNYQFHYQLLQIYRRLGENALAETEARRTDELRRLTDELDELRAEAATNVTDAELRFRISDLARQLDMPELADNWAKAGRLVRHAFPSRPGTKP